VVDRFGATSIQGCKIGLAGYVQQMVSGLFLIVVVTIQTYLARKRAG
jgi:hypothetical protein